MKLWLAPAGLHVEPAIVSDAKKMSALHAGAFFHGWPETEIASYVSNPHRSPVYIACDARRRIAGFMILRLTNDEAELLSIVVAEKWRGKGLGNALLTAGLNDLLHTPVERLFLEVAQNNLPALKLYSQFGFDEVGRREGYYLSKNGKPATALVMRCELG